jgi:hypothetical protein
MTRAPAGLARPVELDDFVSDFAAAMEAVDARGPQAHSHRDPSRSYRPGIGPFAEDEAVAMTVEEMRLVKPSLRTPRKASLPERCQDL